MPSVTVHSAQKVFFAKLHMRYIHLQLQGCPFHTSTATLSLLLNCQRQHLVHLVRLDDPLDLRACLPRPAADQPSPEALDSEGVAAWVAAPRVEWAIEEGS